MRTVGNTPAAFLVATLALSHRALVTAPAEKHAERTQSQARRVLALHRSLRTGHTTTTATDGGDPATRRIGSQSLLTMCQLLQLVELGILQCYLEQETSQIANCSPRASVAREKFCSSQPPKLSCASHSSNASEKTRVMSVVDATMATWQPTRTTADSSVDMHLVPATRKEVAR